MGEGFVVMQSNDVDIYYYMDEAGRYIRQQATVYSFNLEC